MLKKTKSKRLEFSNFKLSALLKLTLSINDNLPVDKLLDKFNTILQQDLNIGKILLFSYNQGWKSILVSEIDQKIVQSIDVERDLSGYKDITNLVVTDDSILNSFDVIIPVFHHEHPIAYVLIADIDEEQDGMSPTIRHLHFIQTLTNIIIVAIENKRLFREFVKQEAIKRELELASQIQGMLIPDPSSLPNNELINAYAYYLPHYEVGGDYYDFLKLSDEEYVFCIADVSGKGISAALIMSNFQANIRALFNAKESLSNIILSLNRRLIENVKGEKFITLFIGKYNTSTKVLTYINAGHNPPVFFDKESQETKKLTLGCVGIGMLEKIPTITEGKIEIKKGGKLICYTDGVEELENENNKTFDMKIIENLMKDDLQIDTIINRIIENLNTHKGKNDFFDDISLIGMDFL